MEEKTIRVTHKGQVTIPIAIREALNLKEGDSVVWVIEEGQVRVTRNSIVARTAGILKGERLHLLPGKEREAMENAIAEETVQRSAR